MAETSVTITEDTINSNVGEDSTTHEISELVNITAVWDTITGDQKDINLSGFTDDLVKNYCSVTVDSISIASEDEYNVFDRDNYSSFSSTNNVTENGITFNSTDGSFTVSKAAIYLITGTVIVISNGTTSPGGEVRIKLNDTTFNTIPTLVHSSVDPVPISFSVLKYLDANDIISLYVESLTTNTWSVQNGTTINLLEVSTLTIPSLDM